VLACCILPAASAESGEKKALALELYDKGRYNEALPLLEELDGEGLADGPLLYRLYYCQRRVKSPDARKTQERARLQLEGEVSDSADLEAPFYLANVYRNLGRLTDMRNVAIETTGRVERGDLPQPDSGVGMFRLGKLYADQQREDRAVEWYSKAVERLKGGGGSPLPPYAAWAARYLAERAYDRKEFGEAAAYYSLLPSEEAVSLQELEKMAIAGIRAGLYGQAAEAWRRAERLDPSRADRSRYCAELSAAAEQLGGLPDLSPDGRPWSQLSQDDLQTILSQRAETIRDAMAEADRIDMLMRDLTASATESYGRTATVKKLENSFETVWGKMIPDEQARIDEARAVFVAASLEFAIKRYGLRETAFFGGFAALIFGNEEWDVASRLQGNVARADSSERMAEFKEQAEELIAAASDLLGEGQELSQLERTLKKLKKKMP
jgi:tetratricopeptide (TPR) repeat protein